MNIKDFPQGAYQGTGSMMRNVIDSKTTMAKIFMCKWKWHKIIGTLCLDEWFLLLFIYNLILQKKKEPENT